MDASIRRWCHRNLLKDLERGNQRMDSRTVSTLNYNEDHLIIKLLWKFRQKVKRPEVGGSGKNAKTERQKERLVIIWDASTPKQVPDKASLR